MPPRSIPNNVDAYITAQPKDVRPILQRIRSIVRKAAPEADEVISYRMPAFRTRRILLYFAAFKHHIGIYPPISGNAPLQRALARYAGPKGNLRFPLDRPMPYGLIARIAKLRAKQAGGPAQGAVRSRSRRRGGRSLAKRNRVR